MAREGHCGTCGREFVQQPMKIYVQVWTEIDPSLNVRVDRDSGQAIADDGDVLHRVSPLGRAAVGAALAMASSEVTAYSLGTGHRDALRHALAAGVSQVVELIAGSGEAQGVDVRSCDRPSVAEVAEWLGRQQPDLVIADGTAGLIAGRLVWSHLAGLDALRFDGRCLEAHRHLGRGAQEVVTARLPAIVRLQTESVRPPYVSRARIKAVSPDAIRCERLTNGKQEPCLEVGRLHPTRPRTRVGVQAQPLAGRGQDRLAALMSQAGPARAGSGARSSAAPVASPQDMAEEFVRYLMHHDLLSLESEE